MAYIMRFESLRAYTQIASEYEEYDELLFCHQCHIPKVTSGTEGSSWVAPTRVAGVWASVTVDATSNDPPELDVLLPTDGATRFHVDAHGVRWEMPGSLLVVSHSSQQDQQTGWGGVFVVTRFCHSFAIASSFSVVKIENISGGVSIWWVEFLKQAVPFKFVAC
eukprot:scaffold29625_cov44-Attheya_sp.AAC.2